MYILDSTQSTAELSAADFPLIAKLTGWKLGNPDDFFNREIELPACISDDSDTAYFIEDLIDFCDNQNATWDIPRIIVDWRWTADEVLFQLENLSISLHNPIDLTITDPLLFVDQINQQLSNKQLVHLQNGDDEYTWLLINEPCNLDQLCPLIGCTYNKYIPENDRISDAIHRLLNSPEITFDPPQKRFFSPDIILNQQQEWFMLTYTSAQTGRSTTWSGRALANQTFKQGIATELEQVLNYNGDFIYGEVKKIKSIPDKQGVLIPKHSVTILLLDSLTSTKTSFGDNIELVSLIPDLD